MGVVESTVKTLGKQLIIVNNAISRIVYDKKYSDYEESEDNDEIYAFTLYEPMSPEAWSNQLVLSKKFRNYFINACENPSFYINLYNVFIIKPITKMQWNAKIQQIIKNYPITDQGSNHICWAHAIATSIYLLQSRIIGRYVPPFNKILQSLLNEFGTEGGTTEIILQKVLPRYKLHYSRVSPDELKNIAENKRVCVASFYLNEIQWFNFSKFFSDPHNVKRAITRDAINRKPDESELRGVKLEDGGHAVVLIDANDDELTFMNSWGEKWGDNGLFRVKIDAFHINFYDIFWYESDLSSHERQLWKSRSLEALQFFYRICIEIDPLIDAISERIYSQPILFLLSNCAKIINAQRIQSFPYINETRDVLTTIGFDINTNNNDYKKYIKKNNDVNVNGFVIYSEAIEAMVTFLSLSCTSNEVIDQINEMTDNFWR